MNKIFLSYSSNDNAVKDQHGNGWVTNFRNTLMEVHKRLFSVEIDIYIDHEKIRQGTDWEYNVDKEISDSIIFIAFLSKNYINSRFCRYEWRHYINVAHQKSRGGEGKLPIYFVEIHGWDSTDLDKDFELDYNDQDCIKFLNEYKKIFENIQLTKADGINKVKNAYLDFRRWNSKGPEYFLTINLSTLNSLLQKPEVEQNDIDDLSMLTYNLVRISQILHERHNSVRLGSMVKTNITNYNPHFIGRYSEIRNIHNILSARNHGAICSLNAFGGLGKTDLAIQYAHIYRDYYATGGVWIVNCTGVHSFDNIAMQAYQSIFNSFSSSAEWDLKSPESIMKDDEIQMEVLMNELKGFCDKRAAILSKKFPEVEVKPRILFILDNLTDNSLVAGNILGSIPIERWFNILITTLLKKEDIQNSRINPIEEIAYLNDNESYEIFKSYFLAKNKKHDIVTRFYSESYKQGLYELIRYVSGFPLAIVITAIRLMNEPKLDPIKLLNELKEIGLKTNNPKGIFEDAHTPGRQYDKNNKIRLLNEIVGYSVNEFLKTNDESPAGINQLSLLILKYASFLDNEYIDIFEIRNWIVKFHKNYIPVKDDLLSYFDDAVDNLYDYHILQRNRYVETKELARMHVLIQTEYRELFLNSNKFEMISILENMYYSTDEDMRKLLTNRIWKTINHTVYSLTNSSRIIQFALEYNIIRDQDRREIFVFIKSLKSFRLKILSEEIINAFEKYFAHYKELLNQAPKEDRIELTKQLFLYSDLLRLAILEKDLKNDHSSEEYISIVNKCIDTSHGSIDLLKEKYIDKDKTDINIWSEYGPLMDNLQFDRVDAYLRLGQFEGEVNKNYEKAIEVLDNNIINELDPFFKEKPEAKILVSSMYNVLQSAKSIKANFLMGMGKGAEGHQLLIDDIPERLKAIQFNLRYDFSFASFNALIQIAESFLTAQDFPEAARIYDLVKSYLPEVLKNCDVDEYKYYLWRIELKWAVSSYLAKVMDTQIYYDTLCDLMNKYVHELSEANLKRLEQEQFPYSLLSFAPFVLRDILFDNKVSIDKDTGKFNSRNNSKLFLMLVMDFYLKVYTIGGHEPINWKNRIDSCSSYLMIMRYFGEEEHILAHGIEFFQSLPDQEKQITGKDYFDLIGLLHILLHIMESSKKLNEFATCKQAFNIFDEYLSALYEQLKNVATGNIASMMNVFIVEHKQFKNLLYPNSDKQHDDNKEVVKKSKTNIWKRLFF